jgi:tripartite-type tricarboxylate transporter receptor subunit TctC
MSGQTTRRTFLQASGAILAGSAIGRPVSGRAEASPLANREVTFIVGGGVGNTFDNFGRALARQFERSIPGLTVRVKNVEQASGLPAGKMLQEGPADGTMLMTTSSSVFSAQLVGEEGVQFDTRQWGWLGKHGTETRVLLRGPGADFKTFEELRAKTTPSSMSVRSKASHAYQEALWLNALLGLKINPVPGYARSVEAESALIQGEVMLVPAGDPTDRIVMETEGVDVVLQISSGTLPARYQGRPVLRDLVSAGGGHRSKVLDFIDLTSNMLRWVAVPPNTQPELLAAWQAVFAEAAKAPDYIAESQKLNLEINYTSGPDIAARVASIFRDQGGLAAELLALETCGEALAAGKDNPCART